MVGGEGGSDLSVSMPAGARTGVNIGGSLLLSKR